jgi:hypothetical protein
MKNLLKPELIGLMDDDKQSLIMGGFSNRVIEGACALRSVSSLRYSE